MSPEPTTSSTSADVIVIGGGIAGATAAAVMDRRGIRVILVDQRPTYPACFKAEKIEPHQADLFRKFGLMDVILPLTGRVRAILDARNGKVFKEIPIEQYGVFYHDMVNAVRGTLPPDSLMVGRVQEITTDPEIQRVTMADGTTLTARLIVDACGTSLTLASHLGIRRETIEKEQSVAFGFTIARTDSRPFPFDSLTYYPQPGATRIGYLTLFNIRGAAMRANFFVFWPPRDERTRSLQKDMKDGLQKLFPRLTDVTGPFDVVSKVEVGLIELYRTQDCVRPGLVLIGDAFQSVCPTTATGISKALADVDALCYDCLPQWLSTPGMDVEKITTFYENPRKRDVDRRSLGGGMYQRAMAVNESLAWVLRRARRSWHMRIAGWKYSARPVPRGVTNE